VAARHIVRDRHQQGGDRVSEANTLRIRSSRSRFESSPDGIAYPIPGNDDAMRAVHLYSELVASAVLDGCRPSWPPPARYRGARRAARLIEPEAALDEESLTADAAASDAAAAEPAAPKAKRRKPKRRKPENKRGRVLKRIEEWPR